MKALSLIEIFLVVAAMGIIILLTVPFGADFYSSQQLEANTVEAVQTLRRSHLKAMAQEDDSRFGVYFSQTNYTLFKGDSYAGRDPQFDEVFSLAVGVRASGLSEVVFSKMEGKPSATGNIILTSQRNTNTININEVGRISETND